MRKRRLARILATLIDPREGERVSVCVRVCVQGLLPLHCMEHTAQRGRVNLARPLDRPNFHGVLPDSQKFGSMNSFRESRHSEAAATRRAAPRRAVMVQLDIHLVHRLSLQSYRFGSEETKPYAFHHRENVYIFVSVRFLRSRQGFVAIFRVGKCQVPPNVGAATRRAPVEVDGVANSQWQWQRQRQQVSEGRGGDGTG